ARAEGRVADAAFKTPPTIQGFRDLASVCGISVVACPAYLSWSTMHDISRPQIAQTNISLSNSRVRLTGSTSLSRSSPPQRTQWVERAGGWTSVRMRFPFARHESERGNGTLKRVPVEWLD